MSWFVSLTAVLADPGNIAQRVVPDNKTPNTEYTIVVVQLLTAYRNQYFKWCGSLCRGWAYVMGLLGMHTPSCRCTE